MFKIAKKTLVLVMVASLLTIPFCSTVMAQEYFETEDPSGGAMMFDLCVVRPVGIVATALGTVVFVISWPFSALGGNSDVAGQKLVKEPATYTFVRPLGEFNSSISGASAARGM
ncbi:hypothetical protein D1BOALGB6SA_1006 [Olavius sp. associated proteobacterium Delta 1]|nr:hypothetical protein D1BOALGB6SA_1006 [Olavius sp. associated proteobacterium Delta 1]